MTELEKFNLMIQGGYNPMGGGINTNQMNDFIAAGFRKPFDNKPVMQNLFNTQQFSQNVEDKKQANQRLKNQQLGNFLLALSDTLRGVNPAQGVLQRQEIFQQQADERKAEANQQNLITNALTIAKESGATDAQLAIIAENPTIAMSVVQSSLKPKENKIPSPAELIKQEELAVLRRLEEVGGDIDQLTDYQQGIYKNYIEKRDPPLNVFDLLYKADQDEDLIINKVE